ncbi:MAG TPA: carboxypeptidase regulatory-like domain-containing protein [Candidatus Eremiobacteraceae bacterium]|nr:carboxypeptidase regulatory-like domain-containing protein [Candidatus Eremiobacteraceae bacterium]
MPLLRYILAICVAVLAMVWLPFALGGGPSLGIVSGIVTFKGTPPKRMPLDLTKEPACVQMHASDALLDEAIVTGRGNGLANVVVYIEGAEGDATAAPAPAVFKQEGCQYHTHVLAVRVGQEIQIVNNDAVSHNIHPLAKANRDWSRIQPAGTPPFSYSYEKEEFIPVKCNIHPWMHGYFAVLKTSHFAVTGEDGVFRLPELPAGKYTINAWHESLGTQSQEITVSAGETAVVYFVFAGK